MARYHYVATTMEGRRATGVQKATNRRRAERILYRRRLRNVRLTEKRGVLDRDVAGSGVKREEIMHLSRQLAAFVRAGLPLIDAVRTLGDDAKNPGIRRLMEDVEDGLLRGETLSDCLERHPKIFPEFYRGILRSAELTGKLDSVLEQLGKYLERDLEARRKVTAAMTYPLIIVVMSIITVVVLAAFVLPRFQVFFASLDAKLPLPTRILIAITGFVTHWWWALLVGVGAVLVIVALSLRTHGGRYLRDRIFLRLPLIGEVIRFVLVERFCRVLATMASAGVSLPEALRVATESLRNLVMMQSLAQVSNAMFQGEGLAEPLAKTGIFPSTASRMIRVGEETGTLSVQLEFTAKYYEGELDFRMKKLAALIEPAVIVAMGLIVGFVAVALVSAMYGVFSQVQV